MDKQGFFSKLFPASLLLLILLCGVWGIYMADTRERDPVDYGREVEILILPGQNAREVASEFQRMGVVAKSRDLALWMGRLGIDRKIKSGLYRIRAGRAKDVAHALLEAKPNVLNVKLLPGALFEEIAAGLKRNDGDVLLGEALENPDNFPEELRPFLPAAVEDRIVFLAPETYYIDPGEACGDHFVQAASMTWWQQHWTKIPDGMTAEELYRDAILASIVQKEALVDAERPVIAGVFKNRLAKDMPLQSCATVVHAWKLRQVKLTKVSYNDLTIESPFNTYIHKSLPPENIGVPSSSSWAAVLKPVSTDMFFFVAKGDGSHVFTRTYREHLSAQKKIKRGEL